MILDGKTIAKDLVEKLSNSAIVNKKLLLILATDDKASHSYTNNIIKKAEELNVITEVVQFDKTITTESFIEHLKYYNNSDISGIMIFSPVFDHLDFNAIKNNVDYRKDVDCLSDMSNGIFYSNSVNVAPATSKAVMSFIDINNIDVEGLNVCVVGASNIVGFPVAKHLLNRNATVTVCNKFTKDLKSKTQNADIIISCAGVANLITKEHVTDGTFIIDVGINFVNGKMCGDVDYDNVINSCNVTKVPGGVGTVTSYMIFDNMCELVKKHG